MTYYRKWLAGQLEWAEELRQRQWELLGSYAVQALISAGVAALACWLISHWMREAWAVALVFLAVILCLLLRQVLIRLPLLTQNGYRRKIRRALAFLDPAGREQFAQDQLEAEQQLDRQIDLVMTGYCPIAEPLKWCWWCLPPCLQWQRLSAKWTIRPKQLRTKHPA